MPATTVTNVAPVPTTEHPDPGIDSVPGSQLRLGDVIDYPHGPAAIIDLKSPDYLTYALGPGSCVIRHTSRAPRAVAGDQAVQVLLPRPDEAG